jgi:hypothetical protein
MADDAFFHDRQRMLIYLHKMIELWTKGTRSVWKARASTQVANGPLIYSHAAHVAELSEGVETLYRAGQDFAALPLIRASIESAMTAAYLLAAPDKTHAFVRGGVGSRLVVLRKLKARGVDVDDALAQAQLTFDSLAEYASEQARQIRMRFEALDGGEEMYITYRIASGLCHPGEMLAEEYTVQTDDKTHNDLGIGMLGHAKNDTPLPWLGTQIAMLVLAQTAADRMLVKRAHKTQLDNAAKWLGMGNVIRLVDADNDNING